MKTSKTIEKVVLFDGVRYSTLQLLEDGVQFGFTIGIKKARLIVKNIEDIKAFVERHSEVK